MKSTVQMGTRRSRQNCQHLRIPLRLALGAAEEEVEEKIQLLDVIQDIWE
jgi:hypothetical protein